MDIIWIIFAILIAIISSLVLSYLFGTAFRQWNEGERYSAYRSKSSVIKTLIMGFIIFFLIGFILSKCE